MSEGNARVLNACLSMTAASVHGRAQLGGAVHKAAGRCVLSCCAALCRKQLRCSASGLRLMELNPDLRTVTVTDGQTEEVHVCEG